MLTDGFPDRRSLPPLPRPPGNRGVRPLPLRAGVARESKSPLSLRLRAACGGSAAGLAGELNGALNSALNSGCGRLACVFAAHAETRDGEDCRVGTPARGRAWPARLRPPWGVSPCVPPSPRP